MAPAPACLIALLLSGCGQIVGLDWTPIEEAAEEAGGTSGAGPSATAPATGGAPLPCAAASACPDDEDPCTSSTCVDGVCGSEPAAAGTPCAAGICDGAGACVECLSDAQCASGLCVDRQCVSCSNGTRDGDESDIDCGGARCDPCGKGKLCDDDDDCASRNCKEGRCAKG